MNAEDRKRQIEELSKIFGLSQSICEQVVDEYKGDIDHAVDHLLTIKNLGKSVLPEVKTNPSKLQGEDEYQQQIKQFKKEEEATRKKEDDMRRWQQAVPKPEVENKASREREKLLKGIQDKKEAELNIQHEQKQTEEKLNELLKTYRPEQIQQKGTPESDELKQLEERIRLLQQRNQKLAMERRHLEEELERLQLDQQNAAQERIPQIRQQSQPSQQQQQQSQPQPQQPSQPSQQQQQQSQPQPQPQPQQPSQPPQQQQQSQPQPQPETLPQIKADLSQQTQVPKVTFTKSTNRLGSPENNTKEADQVTTGDSKPDTKINALNTNTAQNEKVSNDGMSPLADIDEESFDFIGQRDLSFEDGDSPSPPKFTIYIRSTSMTKKIIDDIIAIKQILNAVGAGDDVKEVDLAHDIELAGFIKAKCNGVLKFPIVFMRDEYLGGFETLKTLHENGTLVEKLNKDKQQRITGRTASNALQLNILDRCLETAENVFSYLNPLNWFRGSKQPQKDENVVEFDVIHTNWYWRHLRRKLQLGKEYLLRIHPNYGDVRAAHKYENIEKIDVIDNINLIIRYKDGTSPDYFRCAPKDAQRIIDIVIARSPKDIQLEYHSKTKSK
jgi:glutaredoxin-related protein